jgi:hypothetical protein
MSIEWGSLAIIREPFLLVYCGPKVSYFLKRISNIEC